MAQFLSQPDLLQQTPHHVQLLAETHARRIQLQQQQQQQQSVLVNPNIVVPTHPQTSLYGSENKTLTVQAPSAGGTSVLTSGTGANNLTNGKGKKKKLHTPGAAPPFTQQNLSVQQMQALAANKNQPMHALQTTPYNNCQLNVRSSITAYLPVTRLSVCFVVVVFLAASTTSCCTTAAERSTRSLLRLTTTLHELLHEHGAGSHRAAATHTLAKLTSC